MNKTEYPAVSKAVCDFYQNGCNLREIQRNLKELGFKLTPEAIYKMIGEFVLSKNYVSDEKANDVEKKKLSTRIDSLKNIAIYLEGIKQGKGDLLPLGNRDLVHLWDAVSYLNNKD
jgi:hypothetical protein